MQTFDRRRGLAVENDLVAHRLHAEHTDPVLDENRQNFLLEAVEMRVHHVERHLHGVEGELVGERGLEHLEMNVGAFVAGESDITHFPLLLGFEHGFHSAAAREDAVGIGIANYFVELQQINTVSLQAT